MVLTDRDITRVTETDEELLIFDVSDDALERAAGVVDDGHAITMVFGTVIAGHLLCPWSSTRRRNVQTGIVARVP